MPAAEIFRPVCTANFTILPNELFNLLDYYPNLKTRDPMVLIHLFSKFDYATTGRSWYMNYRTIARELKMGVWSVRGALKRLREAGIASYRRFSNGTTLWTIRLPERFGPPRDTTPAEAVVVEEAKEAVIPASDPQPMPISTAVDAVVVEEAKELPLPACFTDNEARIAQRELAKLSSDELKMAVLAQAEQAILAKQARNPLKYLLGLVNIAMKGEFDMPPAPVSAAIRAEAIQEAEKKRDDEAKEAREKASERLIQQAVNRDKDAIVAEVKARGFVYLSGFGILTHDRLKKYLE